MDFSITRWYEFDQGVVRKFVSENIDSFLEFMFSAYCYTMLDFVKDNEDLFDDFVLSEEARG